jgi:MoxR-like ATPase
MSEKKKPSEESQLAIELIIRRKGFRILTKGTISSIYKELDALEDFTDSVDERLGVGEQEPSESEATISPEEVAKIPTADIPVIKASKRTIDNLEAIFSTPWGRTPRNMAEVMKALEVNAVFDRITSVNVYLLRLVQRGVLRRIEKEGKWVYFKIPE